MVALDPMRQKHWFKSYELVSVLFNQLTFLSEMTQKK